jgi:HSP20 family molecular chaperone IbpA
MNDETRDVATREPSAVEREQREAEVALQPPVDIYEDAQGITLIADMPGVSRERLHIEVDKEMLLIEGDAQIDISEGTEALYADVQATRYRRGFTLSGELDVDQCEANLKDGILTLKIPKREEVRPRKIEVRSG